MTVFYSVLHFLVDGICAFAMFGRYAQMQGWMQNLIFYNLCAFALQLPLGALLDFLIAELPKGNAYMPYLFAAVGVMLTILGVLTHPVILGIGNAMFHVGGGVGTIREDFREQRKGRRLGIFVAPGALGLFLGRILTPDSQDTRGFWMRALIGIGLAGVLTLLAGLFYCLYDRKKPGNIVLGNTRVSDTVKDFDAGTLLIIVLTSLVVVMRSYAGLAIDFTWKNNLTWGLAAVSMVVMGKILGGFLFADLGRIRTVIISLSLAVVGFFFKDIPAFGLIALLCFNMTMPITLYMLVERFPGFAGTAFGWLTFALFLGYLPGTLFHLPDAVQPFIGAGVSVASLALLLCVLHLGRSGNLRR